MKLQTISFNFNFKSYPEDDTEVTVVYEYYHGRGLYSDDPSEIYLVKGFTNDRKELTDLEMSEIQGTAEEAIVTELKADREEAQYDNWKERNL